MNTTLRMRSASMYSPVSENSRLRTSVWSTRLISAKIAHVDRTLRMFLVDLTLVSEAMRSNANALIPVHTASSDVSLAAQVHYACVNLAHTNNAHHIERTTATMQYTILIDGTILYHSGSAGNSRIGVWSMHQCLQATTTKPTPDLS